MQRRSALLCYTVTRHFCSIAREGFNFFTGKSSAEFHGVHTTIPNGAPSITPDSKTDIRNGYVNPQESPVYRKYEKNELFRKQIWFGAVHPNVQIDAKLEYMASRVLLAMDHTSLFFYKKTFRFGP